MKPTSRPSLSLCIILLGILSCALCLPAMADAVKSLSVAPDRVELNGPIDNVQLQITATLDSGKTVDVTRLATKGKTKAVTVSPKGLVRATANGTGAIKISHGGKTASVPVTVKNFDVPLDPDYIRDVMPVLSRLDCNAGTCHGAKDGKNGFKLSLRGYDPVFDVRSLTDDLAGRRFNRASPDQSLFLLKATGAVPHEGGQRTTADTHHYAVLRAWIANGAKLNRASTRVASIELSPKNPVVQTIGTTQQVRVVATFPDGEVRDVTHDAFIETGNQDVALVSEGGLVSTLRRGEAPLLARYEGAYAATTLTVMGNRDGFTWTEPESWGEIDTLVAAKWKRMKIQPSGLCSDEEFLRRVWLDLTGLPPGPKDVAAFLADKRPTREKRDAIIDQLIGNDDYIDFWSNKWADLLQVNRKFLAPEGAKKFREWIHAEVAANTPYDEFVRKIVTATGSNRENPPSAYYKILRDPVEMMENTTHLFLATRFNCNKCHDHPFERWTQDQYYELAAYFAQTGLKKDPESKNRQIGKTAVEAGKPLYEIVFDKATGELKHDRTGLETPPSFPYAAEHKPPEKATRRQALAAWITSPNNQYFARSFANRVWGYLTGTGIIEPLDDIRAGNPATNPELLDYLTTQLVDSKFDVRKLVRLICTSRTYQLSATSNDWNADDDINYSHAKARRLPAEVLYDSIMKVTGSSSAFPGVPKGTRAAALPDVGVKLPDGFLGNLGRPVRESACECERSTDLQLGPVMALVSGPTLNNAISDKANDLHTLVKETKTDADLIDRLFLRILNRAPADGERKKALAVFGGLDKAHADVKAVADKLEAKHKTSLTQLNKERDERVAKAKANREAHWKTIEKKVAADEAARKKRLANAEAALAEFNKTRDKTQLAWENDLADGKGQLTWQPLLFHKMGGSIGATFKQENDATVFASGPTKRGTYELFSTLKPADFAGGITGFRLETLADDRLPNKGPGRGNGNYVVTEFEVFTGDKMHKLENAKADFNQGGYNVTTAIDGKKPDGGNGWAVAGQIGKNHKATIETKDDIKIEKETDLRILLTQNYVDGKHTLGKFRISVTTFAGAIDSDSLPDAVANALKAATDKRDDKQKKALADHFNNTHPEFTRLTKERDAAKKPLLKDKRLAELDEALKKAETPVPIPPKLAEARQALRLSQGQLGNKRLTATQDLAWALMNHPAFLFNY